MLIAWTQDIKDPDDKVQYEKRLLQSRWVLERQDELLDRMEKGLNRQETSPKVYDQPNWEYRQAHANGYRQCLMDIKRLNNLDPKDEHDHARKPITA